MEACGGGSERVEERRLAERQILTGFAMTADMAGVTVGRAIGGAVDTERD